MMSVVTRTKNYFEGAYHEMKKVSWPTRKQTINYGLFVIAMSIALAVFFGVLDYVLNLGVGALLK